VFSYSSVMVNQNRRHGVVMQLPSYAFSIRRMQMGICFVAVSTLIFRLRSLSFRTRSSFLDLCCDFFCFCRINTWYFNCSGLQLKII